MCACVCVSAIASVMSDSLQPFGLQPTRLLCPWDSPSKDTGVGCQAHPQRIFPNQESNPGFLCLLHWQMGSLPLAPLGKPICMYTYMYFYFLQLSLILKTPSGISVISFNYTPILKCSLYLCICITCPNICLTLLLKITCF